ncbi:hypothetical protein GCK32_009048 [Trichostrongylus colubriformis]|uniref:Uncharacterized protein n=1 Tax=Trichostrongylus colubriformis TaxID=6319 RepID=A0AAN8J0P5_TRICO
MQLCYFLLLILAYSLMVVQGQEVEGDEESASSEEGQEVEGDEEPRDSTFDRNDPHRKTFKHKGRMFFKLKGNGTRIPAIPRKQKQ